MHNSSRIPHVVIVGGGFGGLTVAKELNRSSIAVTLIDKTNHHLFQPLLYQVATAGLSPADISSPIRKILSKQKNTNVLMAEITGIDKSNCVVITNHQRINYDYLILATGSRHSYFGHPEWEVFAPGLKSIEDARKIRKKILLSFELAEMAEDKQKQQSLLTFIIIGGGPTGVEMAGSIAELSHKALASDFRRIDPSHSRIILIEAAPNILTSYPDRLSYFATKALERLGVDVKINTTVQHLDGNGVQTNLGAINAKTIIWAAGNQASQAGKWLNTKMDKNGRVIVTSHLTIEEDQNIFVIGDTAVVMQDNKPLPAIAPVAIQEGKYVAKLIKEKIQGKSDLKPFRYRERGQLTTVGRSFAIADFNLIKTYGLIAWLLWVFVHIYFLIGFRNRFIVLFQWIWSYITFQGGARIIVDDSER